MIKELSYNLPGYGFASCYLIGQTIDVMNLLESVGIIEKMQNTCQLGTMKYVYPGAHHTRYEYAPANIPINDCVFIGRGCKSVSAKIRKHFTRDNVPNADQLHEILSCASVLESLNYSGNIICFVGGIKASEYSKSSNVDELDGFIYLPNRSMKGGFA